MSYIFLIFRGINARCILSLSINVAAAVEQYIMCIKKIGFNRILIENNTSNIYSKCFLN